jgi:hypothetical protein
MSVIDEFSWRRGNGKFNHAVQHFETGCKALGSRGARLGRGECYECKFNRRIVSNLIVLADARFRSIFFGQGWYTSNI